MGIFAVSFRISDEETTNGTRQDRYDSFVSAVREESAVDYCWEETTSFILIQNNNDTAETLARAIATLSTFDLEVDLAVVIDLSRDGYEVIGHSEDNDIDALMAMR